MTKGERIAEAEAPGIVDHIAKCDSKFCRAMKALIQEVDKPLVTIHMQPNHEKEVAAYHKGVQDGMQMRRD